MTRQGLDGFTKTQPVGLWPGDDVIRFEGLGRIPLHGTLPHPLDHLADGMDGLHLLGQRIVSQ